MILLAISLLVKAQSIAGMENGVVLYHDVSCEEHKLVWNQISPFNCLQSELINS